MALEQNLVCISRVAGADLSAAQYKFVESNTAGTVTVANAAGEKVLGVVQNDPTSGQVAAVAYQGVSKVVAGGTVAIDADIATDASGRAVAATTGNKIVGRAISGGSVGEIISVLLLPGAAAAA